MINSAQFKNHESYIKRVSGKEIPERLASMVVFGLSQATQVATEENPDLRPNTDFLFRVRALVRDFAPRGKNKVQVFDQYIKETLGDFVEVSKNGKITTNKKKDMADFDASILTDVDPATKLPLVSGRYWEVEEVVKEVKTPEEKFRDSVNKAIKSGIDFDDMLSILSEICEVDVNIVDPEIKSEEEKIDAVNAEQEA